MQNRRSPKYDSIGIFLIRIFNYHIYLGELAIEEVGLKSLLPFARFFLFPKEISLSAVRH
jgi:hypothetical protein